MHYSVFLMWKRRSQFLWSS